MCVGIGEVISVIVAQESIFAFGRPFLENATLRPQLYIVSIGVPLRREMAPANGRGPGA
jgi:hypothetical protein